MTESINVVVDDSQPNEMNEEEEEEEVTSHEQDVTPNVPDKETNIIKTSEDEDSKGVDVNIPINKGPSIRI